MPSCCHQELEATREVMRLREQLRQRELDAEFEQRLDRLAAEGVLSLPPLDNPQDYAAVIEVRGVPPIYSLVASGGCMGRHCVPPPSAT